MANCKLTISIEFTWIQESADCSKCETCGDMIVSSKNDLYISTVTNGKFDLGKKEISVCNSCKDCIAEELDKPDDFEIDIKTK